jgi:hypothetical protein
LVVEIQRFDRNLSLNIYAFVKEEGMKQCGSSTYSETKLLGNNMDELVNQGVLGVVTGILTTVVLFILKVLWDSKVYPFLKKMRYQGVEVGGSWTGGVEITQEQLDRSTEQQGEHPIQGPAFKSEYSLFLNQNAHTLTGSFLFKFKNDRKDFTLDFNVLGYMWEGYITLNFTPKDKRLTSYGTCLLKLSDGGWVLSGNWLFRNVDTECVTDSPLYLYRNQK